MVVGVVLCITKCHIILSINAPTCGTKSSVTALLAITLDGAFFLDDL